MSNLPVSTALLAYFLVSIALFWVSRKPLQNPGSHGFYRFFAWQGILALFALHHPTWGENILPAQPLLSTPLMLASIGLVLAGWLELERCGKPSAKRQDEILFRFEKTTSLVSSGIFRYIRHPMYLSLLFLAWGAFWQRPTIPGSVILVSTSIFLFLTARADERECHAYFGVSYDEYRKRTWAFLPGLY